MSRLEATTSKGASLWIARDDRSDGGELWRLDCAHGYRGRQFDELPRFYRTARGAKQAAALMTGERLTWALPASTNC
ncbi:hypothetical protein N5C70_27715 [Pseudomonas juntendi]|uniref:Uncharacterized protein n=1 Tax=Pseudomonas juntendi TaxID=2666183 RepID=A0ABD4YMR4_9PSED|nr:hypothetical protein [Pseudomonas juntendi]MCF3157316.1 hypothetical protein [Pseudomonas juntendi]MDH0760454.1 hypothetical protein [Pseudomonas juntendi]MDH1917908.1 hypothetical protein [Pseudomonas juntendi]